jgi:purine-nucleoside phosphorylase
MPSEQTESERKMTSESVDKVNAAAGFLRSRVNIAPEIAVITGTGLGDIASSINDPDSLAYEEIPGFPVSTVESHAGKLVWGRMGRKPVVLMQGRFHLYEGYSPLAVAFPIRVLQMIGVRKLLITNAAGGINLTYHPGDIMIIRDHINLTGENPLAGPNHDEWGIRFPDMSNVYDRKLAETAVQAGDALGIALHQGIYAGLKGPSLETPAETRFLSRIGADAVGLSTIMEVIAAVHARMRILGLSVITNINDPDNPAPTTVEAVIQVAEKAAVNLEALVWKIVEEMDGEAKG